MDELEQKAFNELKAKAEALEAQKSGDVVLAKDYNELKVAKEVLEAQLKDTVKAEEHQKVVAELTTIKADIEAKTKAVDEAARLEKEAAVTAKRAALVKLGLPADKINVMTEAELTAAELAWVTKKPGADLGGGSGGSSLNGISIFDLGKLAYTK